MVAAANVQWTAPVDLTSAKLSWSGIWMEEKVKMHDRRSALESRLAPFDLPTDLDERRRLISALADSDHLAHTLEVVATHGLGLKDVASVRLRMNDFEDDEAIWIELSTPAGGREFAKVFKSFLDSSFRDNVVGEARGRIHASVRFI